MLRCSAAQAAAAKRVVVKASAARSALGLSSMSKRPQLQRPLHVRKGGFHVSSIHNIGSSSLARSGLGGSSAAGGQRQQRKGLAGEAPYGVRHRQLSSTPWWSGDASSSAVPRGIVKGAGERDSSRVRQEQKGGQQRQRGQQQQRGEQQREKERWSVDNRDNGQQHSHRPRQRHRTQQPGGQGWASGGRTKGGLYGGGHGGVREAGRQGHRRREETSDLVNQNIARLLSSARKRGDWRSALRVLEDVEREAAVITRVGAVKPWKVWCKQETRLRRAWDDADAKRARTRVYNIVLDTLSGRQCGRWQEAFLLLETMQERGVGTDVYTLNSVLKACSSSGQVELLLNLLTEVRCSNGSRRNVSSTSTGTEVAQPLLPAPDVVSFNIALSACAKAGETSLALGLFDEMRATASSKAATVPATGSRIAGTGDGILSSPAPKPNRLSYHSALSACVKGIDDSGSEESVEFLRRALDILEMMRTGDSGAPSPDIVTYKEVVNAYGRAGCWEQALSVAETALEEGLELTPSLFCAIITALGRAGEWRRCLSVLYADMPAYKVIPDKFCYNMALRACSDAGQVKEAMQILDRKYSRGGGINGFSYSSVLDALARQGNAELGLRLLREIHGATGHLPNSWHYGAVFLSFLRAGDESGAVAVRSEWRDLQANEAMEHMRRSPSSTGDDDSGGPADAGPDQASQHSRMKTSNGARYSGTGRETISNSLGQRAPTPTGRLSGERPFAEEFAGPEAEVGLGRNISENADWGPEEAAAVAPGDRFQPIDLLCLAAFHADNGAWSDCLEVLDAAQEVSRSARSAIRARANELLLGREDLGERVGSVGASTGVTGGGLGSWREVAAKNSDATARAEEASKALRGCYEAAVEALGRAGRWRQSLEMVEEGAVVAAKHGLSLDPACFVPALRSCCGLNACDTDESSRGDADDAQESASGSEAGADFLGKMWALAGVVPDAWCTNIVMEAAVRDENWSLASILFDEAESRWLLAQPRSQGSGTSNARDETSSLSAGGSSTGEISPQRARETAEPVAAPMRRNDRGPRELRKTAVDTMAPTALTYRLALQACAGAAESLEDTKAERALMLVRKMAEDPDMSPDDKSIALAQKVCAASGRMSDVLELRRLVTEAQERHRNKEFLGQWAERRNRRSKLPDA
ncbi:unnamed protein product [Scytosiphon promiscuus]